MPNYPVYPSTPYTGDLPTQMNMGPFDLYPSSSTGRRYQRRFDKMYGRHLAGVEKAVGSDDEPAYALNELRVMAEMDDTNGNAIFDPPGTRPNIYPDAGILASSYAIPGYLHRDRMYAPSEVIDANTGRPVTYVNGGMVSMDSTAEIAFMEAGAYPKPQPYLDMYSEENMPGESTVNVAQNPVPVTAPAPPRIHGQRPMRIPANAADQGAKAGYGRFGDDTTTTTTPAATAMGSGMKLALALGLMGAGVGVVYALSKPSHTPNRRRRRR
jgi:hypothetical protein